MLNQVSIPEELINGVGALKTVLDGVDEIQCLTVFPGTTLKMHGHDNQWEVWIRNSARTAYVCPKGESHEFINQSEHQEVIFAIKGHSDYSFCDLVEFFVKIGYGAYYGSVKITK